MITERILILRFAGPTDWNQVPASGAGIWLISSSKWNGSIITGKAQMLKGGIPEPRNKTIMKMFNLIRVGERAGSGVPDIFSVWEEEGWVEPRVEEQFKLDRTMLVLSFEKRKKQAIKTADKDYGAASSYIGIPISRAMGKSFRNQRSCRSK